MSTIIQPKISPTNLSYLEKILKEWYCDNSDALFTKKNSNLMKYITAIAKQLNSFNKFEAPEFLYRGIHFPDEEKLDTMLSKLKKEPLFKNPNKDYDSWTSDLKIAEDYAYGKLASTDTYGVILKVPYQCIENNLLFTCEYLFTGKDDKESRRIKQQFFRRMLNNKLNELVSDIKESRYQKNQWDTTIKDMEKLIPGLSRALTEFEYILKPIRSENIKVYSEGRG